MVPWNLGLRWCKFILCQAKRTSGHLVAIQSDSFPSTISGREWRRKTAQHFVQCTAEVRRHLPETFSVHHYISGDATLYSPTVEQSAQRNDGLAHCSGLSSKAHTGGATVYSTLQYHLDPAVTWGGSLRPGLFLPMAMMASLNVQREEGDFVSDPVPGSSSMVCFPVGLQQLLSWGAPGACRYATLFSNHRWEMKDPQAPHTTSKLCLAVATAAVMTWCHYPVSQPYCEWIWLRGGRVTSVSWKKRKKTFEE